jgi:hypothetical protein
MSSTKPIYSIEEEFLDLMALHISKCIEFCRNGDPFPLIATTKAISEVAAHLHIRDQAIDVASQMGCVAQVLHFKLSEN